MRWIWVAALVAWMLSAGPAVGGESVRFVVLGDTQGDETVPVSVDALSKVVTDSLAADPPIQFVVVVGDLVDGSDSCGPLADQYRQWRAVADGWYQGDLFGCKIYPLPGNHDQKNPFTYRQSWQTVFSELPDNGPASRKKLNYSFDVGPCHLVAVDTSESGVFWAHWVDLDWLEQDLASSDRPVKLVFGHEPAYKVELDRVASMDSRPPIRDRFWSILAQNNVRAYFCGHDHGYDHWIKDNVHQIITAGGGGAGMYHYTIVDADETDVTVTVIQEPENTVFDQYKLSEAQDVPNEDRSANDYSYWPYNAVLCNWVGLLGIVMVCSSLQLLKETRP